MRNKLDLPQPFGTDDQEVVASLDVEVEGLDEDVAVWGDDGHVLELDVFAFFLGAAAG
jgi:hypothetical protein